MNSPIFPSPHLSNRYRGFTLIELIVVISIIGILTTVLLGNRNQYSERLILKNEIYKLALYIRQAQVYSLGVKSDGAEFNISYGVLVQACGNNERNRYKFFTDVNRNGQLDTGEPEEEITFPTGYRVRRIYVMENGVQAMYPSLSGPASNCNNVAVGKPVKANILFLRPNPSAIFFFMDKDGLPVSNPGSFTPPLCIEFEKESTNLKMTVKVDSTGQISVKESCP